MATPKKRRRATGGQGAPVRALLLIFALMGILVGGMFLAGTPTPRLGIDLAGGTSITLTAQKQPGKEDAVNAANMNTAVSIIERRVNGLGVQEAEVQTQGSDNIVVNIPRGTNEKQAREQVGTTAELGFRPVLAAAPATPPGEETPGADDGAEEGDKGDGEKSGDGSGDKGDGEKSGDKDEDTDKEKADGDKAGDDSSSGPSPQGGVTEQTALKANETESPSADDSPSPSPSDKEKEQSRDPPAQEDGGVPPEVGKQFEKLNCTSDKARAKINRAVAEAENKDTVAACEEGGAAKYILGPLAVPGTNVDGASAVFNQQRGQWVVNVEFTSAGSKQFADTTSRISRLPQPQNQFAISLDGEVVSAPSVSERISGSAEISGSFKQQEADDLANVLKFGALPISFNESSVSTVSPMLGGEQLEAGLIAGGIGLALVVVYMVLYYRGLSLIALASLIVSGVLTYALMSLLGPAIGFALNLPAVCGAIVAIGITADSFIVYFERIRDEVREGRTLKPAVERAWPRARRTILVSDFVSLLAAVVLFVVSVGKVQGFAFTLGLTTLLDVVVVFLFTKPVMTLLARKKFFSGGHPWSGLDPKRLGVSPPIRRTRRPAAAVSSDPKEA
ncbi:protein translocase subunit SecD [Streptomyces sp. XM4193]|uniref:protein translocase subunit SecD n=1 Tax=Streptomyces sp. XM4193 TaxID=2929782 RepID=UPI001FF9B730|nr:protein translocase subunit SecD [Streptomyces sp. XM4193]MCK1797846.1 protein translocase subunit SecD [Streptomyces sp. XM4193]